MKGAQQIEKSAKNRISQQKSKNKKAKTKKQKQKKQKKKMSDYEYSLEKVKVVDDGRRMHVKISAGSKPALRAAPQPMLFILYHQTVLKTLETANFPTDGRLTFIQCREIKKSGSKYNCMWILGGKE